MVGEKNQTILGLMKKHEKWVPANRPSKSSAWRGERAVEANHRMAVAWNGGQERIVNKILNKSGENVHWFGLNPQCRLIVTNMCSLSSWQFLSAIQGNKSKYLY